MSKKSALFCFGRFNPPTIGHYAQFNAMVDMADDQDIIIGVSRTHNVPNNPLPPNVKLDVIRDNVGDAAIVQLYQTAFEMVDNLATLGYKRLTYCVGGDYTKDSMLERLSNYAKDEYGINLVTMITGQRDPTISATLARQAALGGNLDEFIRLTTNTNAENSELLYNMIRSELIGQVEAECHDPLPA